MTFSDVALARRLERAEGRASAAFVDARAMVSPAAGAAWIEVDGALAMFDGVESPLTQTFGLGMQAPLTARQLDRLEAFFRERGAPAVHEVSPLSDASVWPLLHARGYEIVEFTSVMWRPIGEAAPGAATAPGRVTARAIDADEHDVWADTCALGWSHLPELTEYLRELRGINPHRKGHVCFIAELDGRAVAAGGLALAEGVALLAGAATIPSARRQGAQLALLGARLRFAAGRGCDVAMMGARPGSDSQRNAERQGFRIAYTRIKWRGK